MKINEVAEQYAAGKAHWITMGSWLAKYKRSYGIGKLYHFLREIDMRPSTCTSIMKAYKFIEVNRRQFLENPEGVKTSYVTVVILPRLKNRVPEDKFEKLIDDVLAAKVPRRHLQDIVKQQPTDRKRNHKTEELGGDFENPAAVKSGTEKNSAKNGSEYYIFKHAVFMTSLMASKILENPTSLKKVRRDMGMKCREAAIRLNAIWDPKFEKIHKNRREFTI